MVFSAFMSPARVGVLPAFFSAQTIVHAFASPYQLSVFWTSSVGAYFWKIWSPSFVPAELGKLTGSFRYVTESAPFTLPPFAAASFMNVGTADTLFTMTFAGVQPIFGAVANAWIVGVGVAKITSVSAPDAFNASICCVTLPAARSNGCALT